MERRTFIYNTGIFITAASLNVGLVYGGHSEKNSKRPIPDSFPEPVMKGIAYGVNASNPHNTQAWKFQLVSETEMLFFADETRFLLATDPTTRQIHIGCGSFLECMKLGMQNEGYSVDIVLFPNGKYDENTIGKQPIARVSFSKNSNVSKNILSDFIFTRKTSRLKYDDEVIENSEFKDIVNFTNPKYSSISLVNNPSKLNQILPILNEGMVVEASTYRTHDESRKWFRQNDDLIEEKRDGINLPGNGTTGLIKWFAEWQLRDLEPSKWHDESSNSIFLSKHKEKVLSSNGIIVLKTQTNTIEDWVLAGMDYMRLTLACTQKNLYLHPLSQVLQEFDEMKDLKMKFENVMDVSNQEKIQMAVRVGKSSEPFKTYRRFVKDFIS